MARIPTTAQQLIDEITSLVEDQINSLDAAAKKRYIEYRKSVLDSTRELWDKVAVLSPSKDSATGSIRYVERSQAFKYGRFDKLTSDVSGVVRAGALADISQLTRTMSDTYQTQYTGSAWVYNQGYGLPVTGGVKVPLVAASLYSDFYGATFDEFLKKNWVTFQSDILSAVRRGLNQGLSYGRIANQLQGFTDSAYNRMLRIAHTEAGRMQSAGDLDSLKLLDQVGADYEKVWQKTDNGPGRTNRPDHWDMDGVNADKDGVFHLPSGATGPAPRLTGNAADDIFCGCTYITVIDGIRPSERRIRGSEEFIPYDEYQKGKRVSLSDIKAAT